MKIAAQFAIGSLTAHFAAKVGEGVPAILPVHEPSDRWNHRVTLRRPIILPLPKGEGRGEGEQVPAMWNIVPSPRFMGAMRVIISGCSLLGERAGVRADVFSSRRDWLSSRFMVREQFQWEQAKRVPGHHRFQTLATGPS